MLRWSVRSPQVHVLTIAWALIILLLSATPGRDLPELTFEHMDKLLHAFAYALLALLLAFSYRAIEIDRLMSVLLVATGYGFLMECMQGTFFEGRYFDTWDAIANGSGALLGIVIFKPLDRTF